MFEKTVSSLGLKDILSVLPFALPLLSLVLSGAYYFGFLTILGFEHSGIVGLSDFSKSALRWSPSLLSLLLAGVAQNLIQTRAERRLNELESRLACNPSSEDFDTLASEISDLQSSHSQWKKRLEWAEKSSIVMLSTVSLVLLSFILFFFLDLDFASLFTSLMAPLCLVPLFAHVALVQPNKLDRVIALLIAVMLLMTVFSKGLGDGIQLASGGESVSAIVETRASALKAVAFKRLDYYTIIHVMDGRIIFLRNEEISKVTVSASVLCVTSIWNCVSKRESSNSKN